MYRTIVDIAGLEAPEYVDGESLYPILSDQEAQLKKPTITSWGKGNYAVRTEDWRYIRYFDGTEELYNHKSDENEWENLAASPEHKIIKEKLAKRLPVEGVPTIEEYIAPWSVHGEDKVKRDAAAPKNKKK